MNYVKTQFGNIHMDDIPMVQHQPMASKLKTAFAFFSIIIVVLIIFLYGIKQQDKQKQINLETFTNRAPTTIKATSIDVYDTDDLYLENIVLVTSEDNIIDINIFQDKYIKITKRADGVMFSLDFKSELNIKEIILISSEDPEKYIAHVNIDLYNDNVGEGKVWQHSAFLPYMRENSILISHDVFNVNETMSKLNTVDPDKKIIMNESALALTLTEDTETYVSY